MSLNRDTDLLLQSGIAAVRSGDKREGARLLAQVVRKEPQSEDAWFWLAAATDQPAEAAACLRRVLAINPNNDRAKQALGMLESGQGGDAFGSATSAPSSNLPPNRTRALNTAELLAPPGLLEQQAAPPPPPAFGASATPAPPPFGEPVGFTPRNDPYGAAPVSDPYGGNSMGAAPPPPNFSGGGLRLGQLDPNAPTQPAMAPAGPAIYDPGADLRASLLTNAPNPNNPGVVPVVTAATPKQPKASRFGNRNKKTAAAPATTVVVNNNTKKRRSLLPLILLLVVIAIMAVVYFLYGNKTNGSVQQAGLLPADMTATASAATAVASGTPLAGGTDTAGAGTIVAGTPGVGGTLAAGTAGTGVNGTAGAGGTLVAGTAGAGSNGTNGTNGTGNNGANGAAGTAGVGGSNGTNGTPGAGGTSAAGTAGTGANGAATGGAGNNPAPTPTVVAANPATATAIAGTVVASANGGGAGNAITSTPAPAGFPTSKTGPGNSPSSNPAQATPGVGGDLTPGTLPTGTGGTTSTKPAPTPTAAGAIVPTVVGATQGQGNTGVPTPTAAPVGLPTVAAPTPTIPTDNGGPSNPSSTVTPGTNPLVTPTPSSLVPSADVLKYVADSNTNFVYAQYFQSAINEGIIKPYKAGRIRPGVTKINTTSLILSNASYVPQPAFIASSILAGITGDTSLIEHQIGGSAPDPVGANGSVNYLVPPPPASLIQPNQIKQVVLNGPNGPALYYYIGSIGQTETSQISISLGQVASVMKSQPTPADAYQLNQLALEYAQDIRIMSDDMDRFFQTGQVSYLEDLSNYNDKANLDHQRWVEVVNAGFPFKVGS